MSDTRCLGILTLHALYDTAPLIYLRLQYTSLDSLSMEPAINTRS